jgi:hypothetical protein
VSAVAGSVLFVCYLTVSSLESHEIWCYLLSEPFDVLLFCQRLVANLPDLPLHGESVCCLRIEMASETGRVRRSLSLARKRAQTLQDKIANSDEELTYR